MAVLTEAMLLQSLKTNPAFIELEKNTVITPSALERIRAKSVEIRYIDHNKKPLPEIIIKPETVANQSAKEYPYVCNTTGAFFF